MKIFSQVIFWLLYLLSPLALFCGPLNNPWMTEYDQAQTLARRIHPPQDYQRIRARAGTFGAWLRNLPLKKGHPPVFLYNGEKKANQRAQYAVIDIDVGTKDLQQCADAVIRLRAEYLRAAGNERDIHFNFTSGHEARWTRWAIGFRPVVEGSDVTWEKRAPEDYSYSNFRKYLETVFIYAGSYSLKKELKPVHDLRAMRPGDAFIEGGFPGHAVIVLDMAEDESAGTRIFLLAQSYMPAQDVHILRNPTDEGLSPWYSLDFGDTLRTPEWTFTKKDLCRF
jgi:hypothetical protein